MAALVEGWYSSKSIQDTLEQALFPLALIVLGTSTLVRPRSERLAIITALIGLLLVILVIALRLF